MDRLPPEMVDAKLALKQLPPLIKGYLRLGARFGTGAVIDRQFGTPMCSSCCRSPRSTSAMPTITAAAPATRPGLFAGCRQGAQASR
jgi:hypothetical protein